MGFDFGLQEDAVAFCHCRSTCSADGSCNVMGGSICYGVTYRTQAWPRPRWGKENKRLRFKFFFRTSKSPFLSGLTRSDSKLEAGEIRGEEGLSPCCCTAYLHIHKFISPPLPLCSPLNFAVSHSSAAASAAAIKRFSAPLLSFADAICIYPNATAAAADPISSSSLSAVAVAVAARDDLCVFSRVADKTGCTAAATT